MKLLSGFVDIFKFLKCRKKLWLLPIIVIMLLFGMLTLYVEGTVFAPFIYTLF